MDLGILRSRRMQIFIAATVATAALGGLATWAFTADPPRRKTADATSATKADGSPTESAPAPTPSGSPRPSPSTRMSTSPSRSAAPRPASGAPGGFPNASTTGVQKGVALRDVAGDDNYASGTQLFFAKNRGQLVQNLDITGSISVSASNVTIRNVRVNCNNGALAGAIHQGLGAENLTIEHVTIVGSATKQCQYGVLSSAKGTTVRYSNISLVTDAIAPYGDTIVEHNYVHDLTFFPGDHVAAFGYDGGNAGVGPITIRHNTFDDPNNDGNNLIALYSQNGPIVNTTVDNNWLAGSGHIMWAGGYPADCSNSPGVHDVKITNNRFSTKYHPEGGSFSAVVGWCSHASGNVWSGNVWADGPKAGNPVTP
jgi:hypothetical protein